MEQDVQIVEEILLLVVGHGGVGGGVVRVGALKRMGEVAPGAPLFTVVGVVMGEEATKQEDEARRWLQSRRSRLRGQVANDRA